MNVGTERSTPGWFDVNDLLMYLGGAVIAGVGLSWLFLARPWSDGAALDTPTPISAAPRSAVPTTSIQAPTAAERTVDESLRLAGLAQTAGMLLEPPRYSAWALYAEALATDPGNAIALDGIQQVADAVVARATTALEQGRTADAEASVGEVLARLPAHAGAQALSEEIDAQARALADAERAAEIRLEPDLAARAPDAGTAATIASRAAPVAVDPLRELRDRFDAALAQGRLLQPASDSAKEYVERMTALRADDPSVDEARGALVAALLERADDAIAAIDTAAAETWIDEATALGAAPVRIARARAALTEQRIAAESRTPVPAASLALVAYTPPRFPSAAENLEIEGWVDLEFVVDTDGSTTDVTAVAGSHDELFRQEAVLAVQSWQFEPRIFLDRPIAQKAYTRVRFVFE
jgi:TonB family protein